METQPEPRVLPLGQMTSPCLCIDVEISKEPPSIPAQPGSGGSRCAWVLVSLYTEVIGSLILEVPAEGLSGERIAAVVRKELGDEIGDRLKGKESLPVPPFLASRREILRDAPKMTVVVCTHERPEGLDACLRSLLVQEYPSFSVLVVDNAPTTDRTSAVVDRLASDRVRYVLEQRKGLSWARNTALEVLDDGITAWIDDDETADPYWLAELARGFHDHPGADAVAGVMVPGELDTTAQVWFEQFGGHNKERGFTPTTFSPATAADQSPLYPLPPFGTGGNMAIRASALSRIGRFDVALGAGSRCMGCEDTRAFGDLLWTGGTVVYQPTAVTRHFHRRSMEELRRQMMGYGVGLTAYYTSLVLSNPRCVPELIRLLPQAYRDMFSSDGLQSGGLPADFPPELLRIKRRAMLTGPVAYVRARMEARRISRNGYVAPTQR